MGVDIHTCVVDKNGNVLMEDLYDGRNSEWFENIQSCPYDNVYHNFPREIGIPKNTPEKIKNLYENKEGEYTGCYGFCYIDVGKYIKWYYEYKPHTEAGWVTRYNKWLYNAKNVIPSEDNVYRDIPEGYHPEEMCFIEFDNKYCPDSYVVPKLETNGFSEKTKGCYLIYYFDC